MGLGRREVKENDIWKEYQIKPHIAHLASSRNRDRVKDDNLLGYEVKALRKANKWVVWGAKN